MKVTHPESLIFSFAPIADKNSKILILGSMPSVASLEAGMYYSHPRNAFWRLLSDITEDSLPKTNEEKRAFLLKNNIALWDTISHCERKGSLDSDIKNPVPNDIESLIKNCPEISHIFLNGGLAAKLYKKYQAPKIEIPYTNLPSTSPANARGGYSAKYESWKILKKYLKKRY